MRHVQTSEGRWQIADEAADLLAPTGLPLTAWLAAGLARVVKDAPHRVVYHLTPPGLDAYLKHYRPGRWRLFGRAGNASAEADRGIELRRRGVPTPEVLGIGEGPRGSWLLTRTVAGAVPLLDYLENDLPGLAPAAHAAMRQRLAGALGQFLAVAHRAGVRHDDLHPGNLLVQCLSTGPELSLIDLHAVRLGSSLGWPAARGNLVLLDRWAALRFGPTDRRRAWRAYQQARPELGLNERDAARELEAHTERSLRRFTRQLDQRCLGGNRHYQALRVPALTGHAVASLRWEEARGLARFFAGEIPEGSRVLKHSASSTVAAVPFVLDGQERRVIHKRFPAGWREALAFALRPAPALRAYVLGHALRLRGIPTPRPLAVWHQRRLGLSWDGHLLTDCLPAAIDLLRFARTVGPDERQRRWRVIDDLAALIRNLHRRGMAHRDLKAANLLVSPQGWAMGQRGLVETEAWGERVWLIDLVGASVHPRVSPDRRRRDLMRLAVSFHAEPNVSRSDKLRVLRAYLGWEGARGRWKDWWKEVERMVAAKIEGNRRRGRVVG